MCQIIPNLSFPLSFILILENPRAGSPEKLLTLRVSYPVVITNVTFFPIMIPVLRIPNLLRKMCSIKVKLAASCAISNVFGSFFSAKFLNFFCIDPYEENKNNTCMARLNPLSTDFYSVCTSRLGYLFSNNI